MKEHDPWSPGDVVLTTYGIGVIVSCPRKEQTHYVVRLWRMPGKSIGTSSTAYLQANAMIEKLPAAPGMQTMRLFAGEEYLVEVHAYYPSSHSFLVKPVDAAAEDGNSDSTNKHSLIQVNPDDLKQAPSSKFYPLLVQLMKRANQTVTATTSLLQDEKVQKVVQKSTQWLEEKTASPETNILNQENLDAIPDNVDKIKTTVKENLPKEEQMKEVYHMLRDEELTVLLQKGQERLEQLLKTDVSKATKEALLKTGIVISTSDDDDDDADGDDDTSFRETIAKSRDSALTALQKLLHEHAELDPNDLGVLRNKLETDFSTMFDSLSQAAKSDRALSNIFETIAGKTSAWQQASGRLLATKSGSLFMEGATRLQARAQEIFSSSAGSLDWAGEVGSKLTKAFTEGDAAVARLKSIEMGDAVRSRLVAAIEVRSGSQGGLDGIIAGALTTIDNSHNGEKIQEMLTKMQSGASGTTKEAHETLLTVLSNRSEYQDIALQRVEMVLCDLEKHLGEDELTPAEIAAIANGEGGTAAIFEPIAKRASKEISKHLDSAETNVKDPAMVAALQRVRKIISGELSLSGLMDEAVNILNDDTVVAAGENFVKTGEIALDAIEGISGNKIADDVMEIAEKAGITKESVMSQIESLNVNDILDTAGSAVTDEKARVKLISSATDTALDFILRVLPSMPVPPFDGVKDGLVYKLSNLSMQGFKVRKEDIMVEIAGMRATRQKKKQAAAWSVAPASATSDGSNPMAPPSLGATGSSASSSFDMEVDTVDAGRAVKATELLIIDVQRISAVLDDVAWSFEQTYMPYLKGGGKANVKFSSGSIRLQFELRKRKKDSPVESDDLIWEPVLCLHDRSCQIEEVDLVLQGESRLTWIFNKLAAMFKGILRDYVVKTIIGILTAKSGYILEQLNQNVSPYWDLILRTTGLKMEDLVEADEDVIMDAQADEDDDLVELVWRESLPLGMNLLLNDDSGLLKVVDFPRGSQARVVCGEKELDPEIFNGSTIVAVNGSRYEMQEDLFEALKDPSRPKSILFELANPEDAARVKKFVDSSRKRKSKRSKKDKKQRELSVKEVVFKDACEVGLEFRPSPDNFGLTVKGFVEGEAGTVLAAERSGKVVIGDLLVKINDKLVLGADGAGQKEALELLQSEGSKRPLMLTFTPPYLIQQVFEKPSDGIADIGGPIELKLVEENKRIVVNDFDNVSGTAESGGVLIGDQLVFINGQPVGAGCALMGLHQPPELAEVYDTLRANIYPAALTFARPKQQSGNRWTGGANQNKFSIDSAESICVTADSFEQIGAVFEASRTLDIILSDLFAVPGPMQLAMRPHIERNESMSVSIESINGQFVPSYASVSIVQNAMKRSWTSNGKVELVFCDDERRKWVKNLK